MKKSLLILLLLFLNSSINACSLCSLDIPNVHINTIINSLDKKTNFIITWKFDEKFITSISIYDENENNKFDKNEQNNIKIALEKYLKPLNYLTSIVYTNKNEKFRKQMIKKLLNVKTNIIFKTTSILYTMDFTLDITLQKDKRLYLSFFDKGYNFNFILKDVIIKNYLDKKIIKIESAKANIYFYNYIKKTNQKKEFLLKIPKEIKEQTLLSILSEYLQEYKIKMEVVLKDIKNTNSLISYFWLLLFSFLYGILHALGPGHGKSLVAAYFLSENKSYLRGFNISLLIGVVHTFSAFILTLIIYYILNILFSNIFSNIEQIATKLSAIIIISIALYLIYKKYKQNQLHKHQNHNLTSCSCNSCSTKSTDLGIILSAGIVPCPGTITIFLFTFSLGIYFVGFLSAIFMSIGMSLIIFITAYLSIKIRTTATSNQFIIKLFEYASLFFILLLGIFLLIL